MIRNDTWKSYDQFGMFYMSFEVKCINIFQRLYYLTFDFV